MTPYDAGTLIAMSAMFIVGTVFGMAWTLYRIRKQTMKSKMGIYEFKPFT